MQARATQNLQQWLKVPDPGVEAPQARDFTNRRHPYPGPTTRWSGRRSKTKSRVRAKVEHVFAVIELIIEPACAVQTTAPTAAPGS